MTPFSDWFRERLFCEGDINEVFGTIIPMFVAFIFMGVSCDQNKQGECYETIYGYCHSVDENATCELRTSAVYVDFCVRTNEPPVVESTVTERVCD